MLLANHCTNCRGAAPVARTSLSLLVRNCHDAPSTLRRALPLSDIRGHDADPGSHTYASTNAGLDRRVPTNLLVANSRAGRIASCSSFGCKHQRWKQ
jgi:hypothetical protein